MRAKPERPCFLRPATLLENPIHRFSTTNDISWHEVGRRLSFPCRRQVERSPLYPATGKTHCEIEGTRQHLDAARKELDIASIRSDFVQVPVPRMTIPATLPLA